MEADKLSDCEVCGGNKYNPTDGLYFCEECGTQNKFAIQVVYDVREEFLTKTKVQISNKSVKENNGELLINFIE